MERADGTIENKLPLIEDRGQTDRVTILANPNPIRDLDLWPWLSSFSTSCGRDRDCDRDVYTCKIKVKGQLEANGHDRLQYLAG